MYFLCAFDNLEDPVKEFIDVALKESFGNPFFVSQLIMREIIFFLGFNMWEVFSQVMLWQISFMDGVAF